jgi:transposase InsO family protein
MLTKFHFPIQCVQYDNGHEFKNSNLRSFFSSKGIVFHLSFPHSSPQNGKAERGIRTINDIMCTLLFRTINDIMCTLLFRTHLKPSYWVEVLHTATYLFNRCPSCPLHLITPYETLFLQSHYYSHLRIFNCLCFPNVSATPPNKLSPRSIAGCDIPPLRNEML